MSKTGSANGPFFGNFIYDQLLQRWPLFLSDRSKAVDFSFVKDFYGDWGRDPMEVLFKCFLGLSAEELPPDHSTFCRLVLL